MANFYADENFRHPVVEALRRLGHDVLTCQEAGRADQAIPDDLVLEDARASNRILLTQNRKHFIQLDRAGQDHRGVIVCTYDPDAEALARRIEQAVSTQTPGCRRLLRVNRQNAAPPL